MKHSQTLMSLFASAALLAACGGGGGGGGQDMAPQAPAPSASPLDAVSAEASHSPSGLKKYLAELAAMKVDLSVKMQGTELEKARDNLQNGELASERFFVTFGQDKRKDQQRDPDEIAISMVFKACEPPEAVNRLLEEYTNLISPIRAQPPAGAPQPGASEGEATSG